MTDKEDTAGKDNVIVAQFGKKHPVELSDCQHKLSEGCRALDDGDFKNAARLLERSFDYAGQIGSSEYQVLSLLALGDALQMDGHLERAQERLSQATEIAHRTCGYRSVLYAYAIGALGTVHLQLRDLKEARNLLEIAVEVLRKNRKSACEDYMHAFLDLLNCYLVTRDWFSMDKLSRYAHELSLQVLGARDTCTVMCLIFSALSSREAWQAEAFSNSDVTDFRSNENRDRENLGRSTRAILRHDGSCAIAQR